MFLFIHVYGDLQTTLRGANSFSGDSFLLVVLCFNLYFTAQ